MTCISAASQVEAVGKLLKKHGAGARFRIERGVAQAAELWTSDDGSVEEFQTFCIDNFVADEKTLDETFNKLDRAFEGLHGHFNAMLLELKMPMDLDVGDLGPVDLLLGEFDPSAHLTDDLFGNKLAFNLLLNFPRYSLDEKKALAQSWSARDWAKARMGEHFQARVPASIQQKLSRVLTAAEAYVYDYNLYLGNLRDTQNRQLFPDGLRLISHWGIRDELKSHYGHDDALPKQELIYDAMRKIVTQEIPAEVINNPDLIWHVNENTVTSQGRAVAFLPEPNRRYQHILDCFRVIRQVDDYFPSFPTYLRRKFELEREMPENEVEALFDSLLTSPQMAKTAALIRKRLGRDLKPFDIWYDGFKSRSAISGSKLDEIVSRKYPTRDAFQSDLKNILSRLGFSPAQSTFLSSQIEVDASRGAGHAAGAQMKSAKARLRTRISPKGMDYKGYNIAIHEFGHTVEQTLSLHKVPFHAIQGVPASGFSEAFAFLFQDRDLELLDMKNDNPDAEHYRALDHFWSTAEIMAVALVDMQIWRWLYEHPTADAEELKGAVIDIAKSIWNRYFAEPIGCRDEIILAIYAHIVLAPLYLAEYPLGHVIHFQVEKHIAGKSIGAEMERMCSTGSIIPQQWMRDAVGQEISVQPMQEGADKALRALT